MDSVAFEKEIVDYAKTIFRTYPQYRAYHDPLIQEMTEKAQASPIYAGKIHDLRHKRAQGASTAIL